MRLDAIATGHLPIDYEGEMKNCYDVAALIYLVAAFVVLFVASYDTGFWGLIIISILYQLEASR